MISLADFDAQARSTLVEARRRAILGHQRAIGGREILSALVDTDDIAELLTRVGIERARVVERFGDTPASAERLLGELGIDLFAARSVLPSRRDPGSSPWRMRRSRLRPLRVSLESPSTTVPFDRSGRKVLEVAVWSSKRNGRPASLLDLLRGVLSDCGDPAVYALSASGADPLNRLLHELEQLGRRSA